MSEHSPKRKLATILAADVVGYSKMMAEDEEGTVRTLKAYREIFDGFIARHEGRIFNTGGDSVLAEFGSAVEAVRCAMSIQDELRARNAARPDGMQMQFRIGVNVGDVLIDGTDLLGDGVNIAARLEGLAEPGGICLSGSAFEQVKNKLSVGFADLGPQTVKNIPEPVAAYGITNSPVAVKNAENDAEDAAPVAGSAAGAAPQAAAPTPARRGGSAGRSMVWGVAAVALLAAAGSFFLLKPRSTALSSFPAHVSTDSLRAPDVVALMSGMVIRGNRSVDNQPFTITLNDDQTVLYEFARTGNLSGTMERISGTWSGEDFRFCMQVERFAQGRRVCPRIVKEGEKLYATRRRNGDRLPLVLSKP